MNHATMPLERIEALLAAPHYPTLTQQMIAEAMERGRKFAGEVLEYSRRSIVHPSELTLVLR